MRLILLRRGCPEGLEFVVAVKPELIAGNVSDPALIVGGRIVTARMLMTEKEMATAGDVRTGDLSSQGGRCESLDGSFYRRCVFRIAIRPV